MTDKIISICSHYCHCCIGNQQIPSELNGPGSTEAGLSSHEWVCQYMFNSPCELPEGMNRGFSYLKM